MQSSTPGSENHQILGKQMEVSLTGIFSVDGAVSMHPAALANRQVAPCHTAQQPVLHRYLYRSSIGGGSGAQRQQKLGS